MHDNTNSPYSQHEVVHRGEAQPTLKRAPSFFAASAWHAWVEVKTQNGTPRIPNGLTRGN